MCGREANSVINSCLSHTGHEANCQRETQIAGVSAQSQEKPLGNSPVQLWNGLGKPYAYPAEVTSVPSLQTSKGLQNNTKLEAKDIDEQLGTSGNHGSQHECTQCQKSYSTLSGLMKHQQLHCNSLSAQQQKKPFTCKYCGKVYISLGALKMHIRTHTLPCKCKMCGKAFSRPWLLQGHIRTHTGEKPYQCPSCKRAFADRSNLRAHLQTHSKVKKYSCTRCPRSFSRMSLLLKHEDTVCLDFSQD